MRKKIEAILSRMIKGEDEPTKTIDKLCDLHNVISSGCKNCKFNKPKNYHDEMWCRDCQQGNRFEQTDL